VAVVNEITIMGNICVSYVPWYCELSCDTDLYHPTMFLKVVCHIAFFVAVWRESQCLAEVLCYKVESEKIARTVSTSILLFVLFHTNFPIYIISRNFRSFLFLHVLIFEISRKNLHTNKSSFAVLLLVHCKEHTNGKFDDCS